MVSINMVKTMLSDIQDEIIIPQIRLHKLDVSLVEVTHSAGVIQSGEKRHEVEVKIYKSGDFTLLQYYQQIVKQHGLKV